MQSSPVRGDCCPRHRIGLCNNGDSKKNEENGFEQLVSVENPLLPVIKKQQHKKNDPKDTMKKRREKAICIVSISYLSFCKISYQTI